MSPQKKAIEVPKSKDFEHRAEAQRCREIKKLCASAPLRETFFRKLKD
jgi:hypothetical protein